MGSSSSLLDRLTRGQKTIGAMALMWSGSVLGAGIGFITQVLLARQLGPAQYGDLSSALATITILAPLGGFGVASLWLRLFAVEGKAAARWLLPSARFVTRTTLLASTVLVAWAVLGPVTQPETQAMMLMYPVLVSYPIVELVSATLQLEGQFLLLAVWQLAPHMLRLVFLGASLLVFGYPLGRLNAASVYGVAGLLVVVIGVRSLRRFWHFVTTEAADQFPGTTASLGRRLEAIPEVSDLARAAWPFGAAGIFYLIYFQSDVVLLRHFTNATVAANYNIGFTVMAAVYLFPIAIYQKVLLPKLNRWAVHDRERFVAAYHLGNQVMLLSGLVAAALLLWLVPILVPAIFGRAYDSAVAILQILAFAAPIRFVASSVSSTMVSEQQMRVKVRMMGWVALLNVILNLLLIPRYAAFGSSVATVACEGVLLLLFSRGARERLAAAV